MSSPVLPFPTLVRELTVLVARLTAGQQRALLDLAQDLAGVPLDRHQAWDRAGGLIVLAEQAQALSNRLLDGVDQERLR